MIQGARLAAMLPGVGTVMLDAVVSWDAEVLRCRSRSHLDPANPLRRRGRLPAGSGAEYSLQAAALHQAMLAGGVPQPPGHLLEVVAHVEHLDCEAFGTLLVTARLQPAEAGRTAYAVDILDVHKRPLVAARVGFTVPD